MLIGGAVTADRLLSEIQDFIGSNPSKYCTGVDQDGRRTLPIRKNEHPAKVAKNSPPYQEREYSANKLTVFANRKMNSFSSKEENSHFGKNLSLHPFFCIDISRELCFRFPQLEKGCCKVSKVVNGYNNNK